MAESHRSVGEVINIGSNFEIPIIEVAELIAEIMAADIEIETGEQRIRPETSEVERLWADSSKAQELVNWKPEYPGREGLKLGLMETVEWFMDSENLKRYKAEIYNL